MMLRCYLILAILYLQVWSTFTARKSGPYKSTVLSVRNKCEDIQYPYEKIPSAIVRWYLYNSTKSKNLLGVNITIYKTTRNLKGRIKAFLERKGRMELVYLMDRVTCRSFLVGSLVKIMKTDVNVCAVPKGSYKFKGLDINAKEHQWRKTLEYGTMLLRNEVAANGATVACWELIVEVAPAEKNVTWR